jgi:hypothetical protein
MIDLLHMILGNALHGSNDDAYHADDGESAGAVQSSSASKISTRGSQNVCDAPFPKLLVRHASAA